VVRTLMRRVLGHGASLDAGRIPTEMIDWIVAVMRHTETSPNDHAWLPQLLGWRGARTGFGLEREELEAIAKPMLYVYGSADWPGTREVAERTRHHLPASRTYVVDRGGHAPFLDDPAGVAGHVRRFLLDG
jgi:pimeloyl-ACP methyl ester carboxylesterase